MSFSFCLFVHLLLLIAHFILSYQVRHDAGSNYTAKHMQAVDRVLRKLYNERDPRQFAETRSKFWAEHEDFRNRRGAFSSEFVWYGKELTERRGYMWHKINSYKTTEVFGRVACIVCSKILGIGNAERNWGAVKKLKMARPTMGSRTTKKQSTLYAASRIERGRKLRDHDEAKGLIWTDEDIAFDKELNTTEDQPTGESLFIVQRLFYNFKEDWEDELQFKKKDPVAKAKFEQKYKGVMFRDAPTETFVCVGVTYRHGQGYGWCLTTARKAIC